MRNLSNNMKKYRKLHSSSLNINYLYSNIQLNWLPLGILLFYTPILSILWLRHHVIKGRFYPNSLKSFSDCSWQFDLWGLEMNYNSWNVDIVMWGLAKRGHNISNWGKIKLNKHRQRNLGRFEAWNVEEVAGMLNINYKKRTF